MMERHRCPRRSASHGTLRSSYASHGGQGVGPPPFRPLHKPLRSVNENSVLLHSPGALESMLKTTTETGDIGIFTIRPVPPSPLAPRGLISDVGNPHPRPRRSIDNLYRQNVPMRPPSHRDAISEAFSAYGSDSAKSGTGTLSPNSIDDQGQRSYSMTTCGSRHLSHYKSTNTLQSQASVGSNLQRPRSPFPYPTRLKRPGVRPASPAVTENGQIDYSRMVEINRVSYRTVHGHFKHAHSPMSRRPYPLGLRSDVNRSTPSLVPPGPPPNFHGPCPPSVRTYSPASMASWNTPFHERLDSTSTRASSLTSVINMHRRMPPLLRTGQSFPAEPPPRYYDYTEDFENKPPRLTPLIRAVAPPVSQMMGYPQPTILREDGDHLTTGHLAAVFGEGDSAFYDCESQVVDDQDTAPVSSLMITSTRIQDPEEPSGRSTSCHRQDSASSQTSTVELEAEEIRNRNTRTSDIDLLPSQIGRESIDTFNPNLDIESRDIPSSYHYVAYHANTTPKTKTKSPERQVQVLGGRAPTIRSEQGVIFRDDTNYEATERLTPESRHSHVKTETNESYSSAQLCESPSNNGLTSQEIHENHGISIQNEKQHYKLSVGCIDRFAPQTTLDSPKPGQPASPSMKETPAKPDEEVEERTEQMPKNNESVTSPNQQFRRHRRNHAVLRISTTTLPRDDNEGHPHITPTCSTVPLVSPKPISPARQLKVKNSIPQFMKALPPLPGALGYDLPLAATDVPEEDEFAEILVPFSFYKPSETPQSDHQQAANLGPMMGGGTVSNVQRDGGPKFKLKIKTNGCSEISGVVEYMPQLERVTGIETSDKLVEKNTRSYNQNKLKVRSPRRSRLSSSHCSTVRHNPGLGTRRIVTDLLQQKPRDLFSIPPKSETTLLRKRRKPLPQLAYSQAVTATTPRIIGPDLSDERVNLASYRTPPDVPTNNNEIGAFDGVMRVSSMPPHGLIKRLSNLRVLLSSATPSAPRIRAPDILGIHKVTSSPSNNADFDMKNSLKTTGSSTTEVTHRRFGRRIRAKLSRWVRGAEIAMRKCVNKKHNRHEQGGTEQT